MTGEVIQLDGYRERPPITDQRRQRLRERIADIAVEICLLESEKQRLELMLEGDEPA